MKYNKMT